jgi:hypothetical protein
MLEMEKALAEPFMDTPMNDAMPIQMIHPERQRALGYGVNCRLYLSRARTALHPFIGKGRHYRAWLGPAICVIQVVMGVAAIEQNGLLDEPPAHDLGKEIDIFLSVRRTR